MIIERTDKEIIFRLPASSDPKWIQQILNYLKFKEAVKDSKAAEDEANQLANESKKDWWVKNKSRFIR
jgi:hypothetical protein